MPRRLEDREHPSGSRGSDDTDEGLSPLAVRPARAGRLRSHRDLLRHDRGEGRARAHARRRQDRDRRLSSRHDGKTPCAARLLDPQQGPAGARRRRDVADASGVVDAVDRSGGSRRHALFRRARLRARDRKPPRHRQIGSGRLARVRQLRSDRMDRGAALVRRQCRHGRHFRLRRRAVDGGKAQPAAPQGDLSVRSARRLRGSRRLPRRISRRRHPSVSVFAAGLCLGRSAERTAEGACAGKGKLWQEAIANPDFKMYPHVYNVLALNGQHFPVFFDILIDPYDKEAAVEKSEAEVSKNSTPTYTGSGWYGYTYKTHLNGAQNWFRNLKAPHKKLLLAGPAHLDRPVKAFHNEMLRWYDQWLKGIDTGILNDPPVRFWVMGANEWRSASDWPPPQTQWIKFYLRGWERLTPEPFVPSSADDSQAADAFAQMPASQPTRIQKLRYLSEPLTEDLTIAGPSVLHLYAAIDQDDTNWIVILKDVGPDAGVQTAREGERDITPG